MAKYLDTTGLTYFWGKIKAWVQSYVSLSNGTITIGNNSITPVTSHQDISGKANKSEMAVSTSGDKTTITLKTGTSATVINAHQDISGKADKATTLAGYGITDAKIANGVITLGSNTITPLTSFTESDPTVPSWAKASSKPSYTASEVGAVPTTRKVNGHALSGDVTVSKGDVGLGNVTNDAQIPLTQKGAASGVCPLNSSSKIDTTYLPSYVDDVIEAYARTGQTALSSTWLATESASGTAITPETGKIYVLMADSGTYTANSQFRWGGSAYVKLNDGGVSAITTTEIDAIVAN